MARAGLSPLTRSHSREKNEQISHWLVINLPLKLHKVAYLSHYSWGVKNPSLIDMLSNEPCMSAALRHRRYQRRSLREL